MNIKLREKPTYIHKDGKVEMKCEIDGQGHRIFMTMSEFMDLLDDELNALRHHLTGRTRQSP